MTPAATVTDRGVCNRGTKLVPKQTGLARMERAKSHDPSQLEFCANAHRPLTTMVPLMVPLVSPVAWFTHRSSVYLPLAPANRPVPPIMVAVPTM